MSAAVFDCMVFLQAATNNQGPAFACLTLVEAGDIALVVSPPILAEVRDVLSRSDIRQRFRSLTDERVAVFLQKIAMLATVASDVPDAGYPLRDAFDLPYLNLAITSNAAYLVTRDKDLLDLMQDAAFVARFPQLQIVDPVTFLNTVRAMTGR